MDDARSATATCRPRPASTCARRSTGAAASRAHGSRSTCRTCSATGARRARADVVHFQWLPVQALDRYLLPARPRVLTAHDVLPREPRPGQLAGQRALYERMDAVVVHSEHGAARLRDELGVDARARDPARRVRRPRGA